MKQFGSAFFALIIIFGFLTAIAFLPIGQSKEAFDQLLPNHTDLETEAKVEKTNLWNNLFRDQVEHLYLLYPDGTLYHATSNEDLRVNIDTNTLIEVLKQDKHPIKDAVIIIHNHYGYPRFSTPDVNVYYTFAQSGFQGHFLLFVQPFGDVKELKK